MNILNKLTIKHLKMNKKRTIVTIIGVILSTALMVGIGLIVSSIRDMAIKDITYYNGSQHVIINNVEEQYNSYIQNNIKIKNYDKLGIVGSKELDEQNFSEIYSVNSEYLKTLKLNEGVLPSNNKEIIITSSIAKHYNLSIGDIYELNNESLKIVGFYEVKMNLSENYFFTINHEVKSSNYYITFNKPKNSIENSNELALTINKANKNKNNKIILSEDVRTNDSLLAFYGASKYNNFTGTAASLMIILLSLVSIGCVIVIYNSFAISVMERKKQFGLFSSIGATKKQLIKTVYYEAFIVSIIGIPLGILSAYLGIGATLLITNNLLNLDSIYSLELVTYPIFIMIPIIFMLVVILLSAFLPSKRASKISPIEAIRLNDDIKIKGRKVKTPKFIRKLFGIEGEIALKNIKRNKKKYRITIISLFISIVLFVTFSSLIDYIIGSTTEYIDLPNYDAYIYTNNELDKNFVSKLNKQSIVIDTLSFKQYYVGSDNISNIFTNEYMEKLNNIDNSNIINMVVLDDDSFKDYLDKLNKKEEAPILYNKYRMISYDNDKRIVKNITKIASFNNINICNLVIDDHEKEETLKLDNCYYEMSNYYLTDKSFDLLSDFDSSLFPIMFVNEKLFNELNKDKYKPFMDLDGESLLIKTNDSDALDIYIQNELSNIDEKYEDGFYYVNVTLEYKMFRNIITVVKMFVYGFITLVTLIGVTSVVNTINTSINLRRKEFAVLRSIGLTPKGFNKILYFESLFFGLKSLLYALPVSIGIIYLIHLSMNEVVIHSRLILPIENIIFAIIGVFVIILFTMMYASRRIKKENILEAIRTENI